MLKRNIIMRKHFLSYSKIIIAFTAFITISESSRIPFWVHARVKRPKTMNFTHNISNQQHQDNHSFSLSLLLSGNHVELLICWQNKKSPKISQSPSEVFAYFFMDYSYSNDYLHPCCYYHICVLRYLSM